MKKIFLIFGLLIEVSFLAQTPEFNLQKYWFYRQRFKQFFVSIGTATSQSLAVLMIGEATKPSNNILKS